MNESKRVTPYQAVIESPLPAVPYLGFQLFNGRLGVIDFLGSSHTPFVSQGEGVEQAVALIRRYFSNVPLDPMMPFQADGTAFQQRVWKRLCRIPCGQVMRYGELAAALGSSPRAVAGACRANPIPILIPCHRVVATTGLGGYMGETAGEALAIKQWLLQHEGYV